jgi:alpha-beta hydrolase superfamily lysophospholipase
MFGSLRAGMRAFRLVLIAVATAHLATAMTTAHVDVVEQQVASVDGYWEGAVMRDGAARVIRLDFSREGAELRVRVEMPDFINFAFPPVRVQPDGDRVQVRLPMLGNVLLTHNEAQAELRGEFTGPQAQPVSVVFRRAVKPAEVLAREEVRFPSGSVTLAGTLVTPLTRGPHPVVVWLSGRGTSARYESGLVGLLAQYGVASLVYDKRGSGRSTGNFAQATFDDLTADASAAVRFLAQRADINAKQIGLHAESAGGWVAPAVVTQLAGQVAFVVTAVGPAESLYDQQLHAYQAYVRTGGFQLTPEEVELSDEHIRRRLRVAFRNEGHEAFQETAAKIKGTRMARFLLSSDSDDAADFDWLRRNDTDPVPHLKKITVPWLAFYGTRDYIVPPPHNTTRLEQYLTEAGNTDFKIVVLDNADHSLVVPNTASPRFVFGRAHHAYAQTMLEWILARVNGVR